MAGSTTQEAEYLLVHGLLHLLGYDHAEPEEKAEMFGLKDKIIASWAAQRPDRASRSRDERTDWLQLGDRTRPGDSSPD